MLGVKMCWHYITITLTSDHHNLMASFSSLREVLLKHYTERI